MWGITSYIFRQLAVGTLLVSIALAGVVWLTQSLRFIQLIISKGMSFGTFIELTMLVVPGFLMIILPIAVFAVVLFVYNKLIMDHELVVVQAAGVSRTGLARPAILIGLLVTAVGFTLTLYAGPKSVKAFKELQWTIRNDASAVLLREGSFNQVGNGLTVYLAEREQTGVLRGILVHDTRDPAKTVTMMADTGQLLSGPNGPRLLMEQGNRQEVSRGGGELSLLYFDSYTADFGTLDSETGQRFLDPRERPIQDLFTLGGDDGLSERNIRKLRIEGHTRLTGPLLNLGHALIAAAFLLSGTFDRRGQSRRVMAAIAVMMLLQGANLGATSLASGQLMWAPLMYVVAVLPILFAGLKLAAPAQRMAGGGRLKPA